MVEPSLVQLPSFTVYGVSHFGDYHDIQQNFYVLQNYLTSHKLLDKVDSFFGLYQQGACTTDINHCQFDACVTFKHRLKTDIALQHISMANGIYLHYQHIAPHQDITQSYQMLYLDWLPKQDYQINTQLPAFEQYQSNPATTMSTKLITDIYIPILTFHKNNDK
ncbi:AraC family transcriptional regulator [Neisseria sp. Ec49-e6-T10]|uniref:AraC family transcriptional regulator n=1 Tax=Neisseria sp. Ec49-e6-T10 TaxID=3140744 RepID=UPI003EB8549E